MASSLTHSQTQIPNSGLQGPAWSGLRDSLAHVSHHSSHLLGSVLWFLPILVHNKGPPKDLCSCCCLCLKHLSPKQAYNSLPLFFQSLPKCNHSLWSSSASALTLCPLTLLYDFHRPYHSLLWNGFFHLPSLDCNLNESRDCFIHSRIPQNPAQCLACAIEYPVPISPCWMNTWIL